MTDIKQKVAKGAAWMQGGGVWSCSRRVEWKVQDIAAKIIPQGIMLFGIICGKGVVE